MFLEKNISSASNFANYFFRTKINWHAGKCVTQKGLEVFFVEMKVKALPHLLIK
jgi:hypothetical protein